MTVVPDISHIVLQINGAYANPDIMADLQEVSIDHSLHMPSMFTLRFRSYDMKWLQATTFREGTQVVIYYGERPMTKLLSGKIAALEPELGEGDPTLVVRGYDLFHSLYRGRHRRSFNQVTDTDLARRLCSEAGLQPGQIDSSREVHEYVFQNNQTNAEFLLQRARLIGYELWVEEDRLNFRQVEPNGSPIELAWGDTLRSFRPRLSTAEQVDEVEVRGWDPKQKREVVGRARRGNGAPRIGLEKPGADIARDAWGEAQVAVVTEFVRSPAEAEALAQATLDELASAFVEAEGTCDANPDIVPGRQVQIYGVGKRFEGAYYVTQVIHEWSKGPGLTTHFSVTGHRDRGVWSLLEDASSRTLGTGLVIGLVTNNHDPEWMGRVKVKFPWLSGQDESAWARLVAPMAGGARGFFYLPEIDDEVLVGFEHGDIHRPFILGALWNGADQPPTLPGPTLGGDGSVYLRTIQTPYGHRFILDDTPAKEKIIVTTWKGHRIILDDTPGAEQIDVIDFKENIKVTMTSQDSSIKIQLLGSPGDLTIEAQGKVAISGQQGVEVNSQQGAVKLAGQTGAEMTTQAQLKLSGQTGAEMTTQAELKLSGMAGAEMETQAQLKLSGQATAEISSTGQTTLKGTMVNVEGTGPTTIKGMPVMLN